MKKVVVFLCLLSLALPVVMAQSPARSHTISGYVTDGKIRMVGLELKL